MLVDSSDGTPVSPDLAARVAAYPQPIGACTTPGIKRRKGTPTTQTPLTRRSSSPQLAPSTDGYDREPPGSGADVGTIYPGVAVSRCPPTALHPSTIPSAGEC